MLVKIGDKVKKGESLLILESMKMEINIQAPCDGEVTHTFVKADKQVNAGQALIVIDEGEGQ